MRIDKFLQSTGLIRRRTLAKEACESGRVSINGRVAKPGAQVEEGDEVTVRLSSRLLRVRVAGEPVAARGRPRIPFEVIEDRRLHEETGPHDSNEDSERGDPRFPDE